MNLDPIYPPHLQLARDLYARLKPGQEIKVAAILLSQPALDHYLSGCCSGYTLGYRFPGARPDDFKNWVLFRVETSLENDPKNRRTYVDSDRRHLYNYDAFYGIFTPIKPL